MKRYEYVTIELENKKAAVAESVNHRKMIDEYAAKGYSYVDYIPCTIGPSGKY